MPCVLTVVSQMLIRRYSELRQLNSFEDRYRYLRLAGIVGESTFGFDRCLNQTLYQTSRWKSVRNKVILRDNGCDLGDPDHLIKGHIIVHHMNPITVDDIADGKDWVFDPEFLICVSHGTHNAIHFGDENLLPKGLVERTPFDTCPWAKERRVVRDQ